MKSSGGRRPGRARPPAPGPGACSPGPAGGAVGAGAARRAVGRRQRARPRHGRHLVRRLRGRGRAGAPNRLARDRRAGRSSCRWSTSTPSAPAAARSAGATPGGALRVGPRSAGAEPGPACYGRGGTEPTVTDANLAARLPRRRLDARRRRRARPRRGRARAVGGSAPSSASTSSRPPRGSSGSPTRRWCGRCAWSPSSAGVDPRGFALMPFGGAGPMHAAALAAELGIDRILCPRASGVLSALGLIASERRRDTARTVMLRGDELTAERIAAEVAALRESIGAGLEEARRSRSPTSCATAARRSSCRSPGPPTPTRPSWRSGSPPSTSAATATASPTREVELVNVRLALGRARARRREPRAAADGRARARRAPGPVRRRAGSRPRSCAASRPPGTEARGPCVFELPEATLVLPPGLAARRSTSTGRSSAERSAMSSLDPVTLQVLVGAPARGLRGDGRGADPRRALAQHQGAPRLLDGALRRRGRAGDAGRAHPGPPRLDARRGRRGARRASSARATSGSSTTPIAAAPTCPTSP